jgi:hypothetical protein
MAAVTGNRGGEVCQDIEALKVTGFSDGQQASRGQLPLGAAVTEADFAPLHTGAERSFGTIIGGLDAFLFQEGKQALVAFEKSDGQIANLAMRAVQVPFGQFEDPFLKGERSQQQLTPIDLTATKFVP